MSLSVWRVPCRRTSRDSKDDAARPRYSITPTAAAASQGGVGVHLHCTSRIAAAIAARAGAGVGWCSCWCWCWSWCWCWCQYLGDPSTDMLSISVRQAERNCLSGLAVCGCGGDAESCVLIQVGVLHPPLRCILRLVGPSFHPYGTMPKGEGPVPSQRCALGPLHKILGQGSPPPLQWREVWGDEQGCVDGCDSCLQG